MENIEETISTKLAIGREVISIIEILKQDINNNSHLIKLLEELLQILFLENLNNKGLPKINNIFIQISNRRSRAPFLSLNTASRIIRVINDIEEITELFTFKD